MRKDKALKVALVVFGLLFLAGAYPLATSLLQPDSSEYAAMMLSLYVTLGVFLLLAVRNPGANRSLILFTAWSSFAHGGVMALQSIHDVAGRPELLSATALMAVIGIVLLALAPARPAMQPASAAGH